MRPPVMRVHLDGLIVDSFAGGGGASTGIEWALGRSPDIAINHDPEAIAMHRTNHPATRHLLGDVWDVKPKEACGGQRVAVMWLSPDCTYHSKARGTKPFRDPKEARGRRGLASVAIRWAKDVRPEWLFLENVEEWKDWGPLGPDNRPDPARRGHSFRRWWGTLANLGYHIEMRELRACDYGAPTIRKRLFVIATCTGQPIIWPVPTHGAGTGRAHRSAAECIDWSIPCPSIFERERPLAEKTLRRVARGIRRFVVEAPHPFIVPTNHGGIGRVDDRSHSLHEPLRTITGGHRGEHALVTPFIAPATHGDSTGRADTRSYDAQEPLRTITTRGAQFHIVAPTLVRTDMHKSNAGCVYDPLDPLRTVTTAGGHGLIAATLQHSGNGERAGQDPRIYDIRAPLSTVMAQGQKHALVHAFLARHYSGHGNDGLPLQGPISTITARDHHSLVTAHMLKLYGSCADGQSFDVPAPTVRARGTHLAEVRAFLTRYNGVGDGQSAQLPLGTVTTKDRFGIVQVAGEDYEIADIGLRMLGPRELFRAQGFSSDYRIQVRLTDAELQRVNEQRQAWCRANNKRFKVRTRRSLTKEAQIRMCGNSVAPWMAYALVGANVGRREVVAA